MKKKEEEQLKRVHDEYKSKFQAFDKSVRAGKKQTDLYDKEMSKLDRQIKELEEQKKSLQLRQLRQIEKEKLGDTSVEPERPKTGKNKKKGRAKGISQEERAAEEKKLEELNIEQETQALKDDWEKEKEELLKLKEEVQKECNQLQEKIKEKKGM